MNSNNIILIKKSTEEEATICWDGETCKPDEFGCCVVCCECKACICNLQKAEEEEEEEEEVKCGICEKKLEDTNKCDYNDDIGEYCCNEPNCLRKFWGDEEEEK